MQVKKSVPRAATRRARTNIAPYRSRYEYDIATNLKRRKVKFDYEEQSFEYTKALRSARCVSCASSDIIEFHSYTPDFILSKNGLIIEAKGRFVAADRKKVLDVLESPHNTITRDNFRMLFMQDRKLSAKSKLRYGSWCDKNDIEWAIGPEIPEDWV